VSRGLAAFSFTGLSGLEEFLVASGKDGLFFASEFISWGDVAESQSEGARCCRVQRSELVFPRKSGRGERSWLLVSLDGDFGFENDY
jgi:hypothetical protein